MKFSVKRSTWIRGGRDGLGMQADAALENGNGQMCCLGHCISQLGVPTHYMRYLGTPWSLHLKYASHDKIKMFIHKGENNLLSMEMMKVNDDITIDDATREAKLIELMAQEDHELSFED